MNDDDRFMAGTQYVEEGGGVSKDDCLSVERKSKKVSSRRIARTLAHRVTIVVKTLVYIKINNGRL